MTASLLRVSAISGLLKLRDVLSARPGWRPEEAALFIRQTDMSAGRIDLDAGCALLELVPMLDFMAPQDVVRACISAIARSTGPGWLSTLSSGRLALGDSLDDNTRQCFKIAGAFDPIPLPETILWLDELALAQFAVEGQRNLVAGRDGELLTLEAEAATLKMLSIPRQPRWVALDDNRAGFDIESWRLDADGNELPILIEVKACSGQTCRFFLTRHEWETACRFPEQYRLQVWRLADKASVVFTFAEISEHIPHDAGVGRWESVQVQLASQVFATPDDNSRADRS